MNLFSRKSVRSALWKNAYNQKQIPGLEPFFWLAVILIVVAVFK
jgi:hypothetical protein